MEDGRSGAGADAPLPPVGLCRPSASRAGLRLGRSQRRADLVPQVDDEVVLDGEPGLPASELLTCEFYKLTGEASAVSTHVGGVNRRQARQRVVPNPSQGVEQAVPIPRNLVDGEGGRRDRKWQVRSDEGEAVRGGGRGGVNEEGEGGEGGNRLVTNDYPYQRLVRRGRHVVEA